MTVPSPLRPGFSPPSVLVASLGRCLCLLSGPLCITYRPAPGFSTSRPLTSLLGQGEIDAREDSFRGTIESGQRLLDSSHESAGEIQEKLELLSEEKVQLLELWEERRVLYEQCMDLQLFYRDTEQADTWMAKQEVSCTGGQLGLWAYVFFFFLIRISLFIDL